MSVRAARVSHNAGKPARLGGWTLAGTDRANPVSYIDRMLDIYHTWRSSLIARKGDLYVNLAEASAGAMTQGPKATFIRKIEELLRLAAQDVEDAKKTTYEGYNLKKAVSQGDLDKQYKLAKSDHEYKEFILKLLDKYTAKPNQTTSTQISGTAEQFYSNIDAMGSAKNFKANVKNLLSDLLPFLKEKPHDPTVRPGVLAGMVQAPKIVIPDSPFVTNNPNLRT